MGKKTAFLRRLRKVKPLLTLFFGLAFSICAQGALDPRVEFTSKDMWTLSRKITASLWACKPLRVRPSVVVDVKNETTEFVDKTQFSELIHSMMEGKTHLNPETKEPDYEIRAKLEFKKQLSSLRKKPGYTLTAQVFQADEMICQKEARIAKNAITR